VWLGIDALILVRVLRKGFSSRRAPGKEREARLLSEETSG
jgi:hypothetical protein